MCRAPVKITNFHAKVSCWHFGFKSNYRWFYSYNTFKRQSIDGRCKVYISMHFTCSCTFSNAIFSLYVLKKINFKNNAHDVRFIRNFVLWKRFQDTCRLFHNDINIALHILTNNVPIIWRSKRLFKVRTLNFE